MTLANYVASANNDAREVFFGTSLVMFGPRDTGPTVRGEYPTQGISIGGGDAVPDDQACSLGATTPADGAAQKALCDFLIAGDMVAGTLHCLYLTLEDPAHPGQTQRFVSVTEAQTGDAVADAMDDVYTNLANALAGTAATLAWGRFLSLTNPSLTLAQISTILQNTFGNNPATAFAKTGTPTTKLTLTSTSSALAWNFAAVGAEVQNKPSSKLPIASGMVNLPGWRKVGPHRDFNPNSTPVIGEVQSDTSIYPFLQPKTGETLTVTFTAILDDSAEVLRMISGSASLQYAANYTQLTFGSNEALAVGGLVALAPSKKTKGQTNYKWIYRGNFTSGLPLQGGKATLAGVAGSFAAIPDDTYPADPIGHAGWFRTLLATR